MDLPYINMHPPRVYMCSPSWTPLPLPSPYHPSGSSQCTSPKLPVSCIKKNKQTYNLDELLAAVFLSFSSFPVIFNSFNLFQKPTSDVLWGRTCKQRLGFVHQVVTQKRTRPKAPTPTPRTSLCCFCRGVLGFSSVCSAYGNYYLLT